MKNNREYDFSKLTESQQTLLTFQGWSSDSGWPQPSRRTVKKLIDRGLVIEHSVTWVRGNMAMLISEYEVPIPVHAAWCAYCSRSEAAQ
jgi:hypothetical protein